MRRAIVALLCFAPRFDAKLEQRLAQFEAKLERLKTELIRWMFTFWAGTLIAVLGTMIALVKL